MTKIHIVRLLLAVFSAFILAGSSTFMYALLESDSDEVIEVEVLEKEPTKVKFEGLGLLPGESCEYTVKLTTELVEVSTVSFDFTETDDSLMKDYVYVTVEAKGEKIYTALLADCLSGETVIFDYEKLTDEFKIIYTMPADVGNEAQSTEARFELLISAIA